MELVDISDLKSDVRNGREGSTPFPGIMIFQKCRQMGFTNSVTRQILMSVRTDADIHLQGAKDNLQESLEDLSQLLVNDCDGHDAWNEEYTNKMVEAFSLMQKAKRLLK